MKSAEHKNRICITALLLAAAVLLSGIIVCSIISVYSYTLLPDHIISVLPESSGKVDFLAVTAARGLSVYDIMPQAGGGMKLDTETFFRVEDENGVWGSNTQIELFKSSYENENGTIVAAGRNGDKIVAPGTSGRYVYQLINSGNSAVDYNMKLSASLSDSFGEYTLPLRVRLTDEKGNIIVGGEDEFAPILNLDGAEKIAVLGSNCYSAYTLEWEWPFESGNDELDTLLGELAASDDLVVTLGIDITAEYDIDPDAPGGNPQTRDDASMTIWILIMMLALAFVLVLLKKRSSYRGVEL